MKEIMKNWKFWIGVGLLAIVGTAIFVDKATVEDLFRAAALFIGAM